MLGMAVLSLNNIQVDLTRLDYCVKYSSFLQESLADKYYVADPLLQRQQSTWDLNTTYYGILYEAIVNSAAILEI